MKKKEREKTTLREIKKAKRWAERTQKIGRKEEGGGGRSRRKRTRKHEMTRRRRRGRGGRGGKKSAQKIPETHFLSGPGQNCVLPWQHISSAPLVSRREGGNPTSFGRHRNIFLGNHLAAVVPSTIHSVAQSPNHSLNQSNLFFRQSYGNLDLLLGPRSWLEISRSRSDWLSWTERGQEVQEKRGGAGEIQMICGWCRQHDSPPRGSSSPSEPTETIHIRGPNCILGWAMNGKPDWIHFVDL